MGLGTDLGGMVPAALVMFAGLRPGGLQYPVRSGHDVQGSERWDWTFAVWFED